MKAYIVLINDIGKQMEWKLPQGKIIVKPFNAEDGRTKFNSMITLP